MRDTVQHRKPGVEQRASISILTWFIKLAIPFGIKDNTTQPKDPERG